MTYDGSMGEHGEDINRAPYLVGVSGKTTQYRTPAPRIKKAPGDIKGRHGVPKR